MTEDTSRVDLVCMATDSELIDVISPLLFRPFTQFIVDVDVDADTDMIIKSSRMLAELSLQGWWLPSCPIYAFSLDMGCKVIFYVI